ncbi:MAG: camphor resistance protein CrcB [Lentisphaerae bacterium ADurb.Bin242]|nr:MAG: camphor resistance protein CrcB [Lentisphaerae bacterium ADurb.Bin242]
MKILLLSGCAGFLGTLLRFGVTRAVNHALPGFPWGTLAVNVTGAFLAGFLFVLCRVKFMHYEAFFPVLFIGFLGGYTTFSAFALESTRYYFDAQYVKFIGNIVLQNGMGILAAGGGLLLARLFFCR